MKKVVLSMALVAMMSVSFVSCKDAAKTEETPVEEVAPVMEEAIDSAATAVDTAAAAATTEAAAATTEAAAPVKEEVKK
ncbi:hypothetical protein [Flavobacterium sp.]|uniref:hypothetical protein n=1 Tax=Flavobacterium sp. TaxID=239 RepID=UPI003D6BC3D1